MDKKYIGSVSSRNRGGFGSAQLFAGIRYGPPFENHRSGHSYPGAVFVILHLDLGTLDYRGWRRQIVMRGMDGIIHLTPTVRQWIIISKTTFRLVCVSRT